jgi:hypothetical protein
LQLLGKWAFAAIFLFVNMASADPVRSGWLEQVIITPPDIVVHAKLDTGAESCSLHAEDLQYMQKRSGEWVLFTLVNRYGDKKTFKRKVQRTTRIKLRSGGYQTRPVIRLGVCIGSRYAITECNLVDRSHFVYPMLIGRNFLAGKLAVDSSETYLLEPKCR